MDVICYVMRHILSLFPNDFSKFKKKLNIHVRSPISNYMYLMLQVLGFWRTTHCLERHLQFKVHTCIFDFLLKFAMAPCCLLKLDYVSNNGVLRGEAIMSNC